MLDAFSRAGLTDGDLVTHYALLAAHMLGSSAGIARSRSERGNEPGEPAPWIESPLLVDREKHPLIAELSPLLRALDDRDMMMLGVDTILDSAERTARAARA